MIISTTSSASCLDPARRVEGLAPPSARAPRHPDPRSLCLICTISCQLIRPCIVQIRNWATLFACLTLIVTPYGQRLTSSQAHKPRELISVPRDHQPSRPCVRPFGNTLQLAQPALKPCTICGFHSFRRPPSEAPIFIRGADVPAPPGSQRVMLSQLRALCRFNQRNQQSDIYAIAYIFRTLI